MYNIFRHLLGEEITARCMNKECFRESVNRHLLQGVREISTNKRREKANATE